MSTLLFFCTLASAEEPTTPASDPATNPAPPAPAPEPAPPAPAPIPETTPVAGPTVTPPPPATVATPKTLEERQLEANFQLGFQNAPDDAYQSFSDASNYTGAGIRLGYRIIPRITLLADWQHGDRQLQLAMPEGNSIYTRYSTEQIGLGAKADLRAGNYFYPYLNAQALLLVSSARMDDDLEHDDNLTQTSATGVGAGIYTAVGMEFRIPMAGTSAQLAPYLEGGYGYISPGKLENLGSIGFWGFSGRAGLGVRL